MNLKKSRLFSEGVNLHMVHKEFWDCHIINHLYMEMLHMLLSCLKPLSSPHCLLPVRYVSAQPKK